tara:strand:+ start:455 stop:670 length:216 start_codon:yes stop_codon:yes gene_type:complete
MTIKEPKPFLIRRTDWHNHPEDAITLAETISDAMEQNYEGWSMDEIQAIEQFLDDIERAAATARDLKSTTN